MKRRLITLSTESVPPAFQPLLADTPVYDSSCSACAITLSLSTGKATLTDVQCSTLLSVGDTGKLIEGILVLVAVVRDCVDFRRGSRGPWF